jgi:hypothetical protein
MDPERRVYCTFCEQTFLSAEVETCPLCRKSGGLVDAASPAAPKERGATRSQEPGPPPGWFAGYQFVRLLIGGVGCGILGIVLVCWELSQRQPSPWAVIRNAFISVLGFGLVGVMLWFARGSR